MKYAQLYVLFLMFVFFSSCDEQKKKDLPKEKIRYETKDKVSSRWPGDTAIQIKKGSNGSILIAAVRGVYRYDGKLFTNLTSKLGLHRFSDVWEDTKGGLWFATNDSGVYYDDGKSFQHFTTREGLANNSVICIYEDKAGIMWFGTAGGASRYDGRSFQHFITKGEYRWDTFITTFMEDKAGELWISARGAIYKYDGKTVSTFTNTDNGVYDVYSIMEDKKGNIWFVGWDGLRRYDGKTFTKFEHNKGYASIIEDTEGNIWTSGNIGASNWAVSRYDKNTLNNKNPTVTKIMSAPLGTSSGILEAEDGSIWFGNNDGLYRYDGKTITDFTNVTAQQ